MSIMTKASAFRSRSLKASIGAGVILASAALVLSGCSTPGGGGGGPVEDLSLKIGTALPQTGNLAFLGPPEEAGVASPCLRSTRHRRHRPHPGRRLRRLR